MSVSDSTHIPRLKVLLAFSANRQSRIRKFYIQLLIKTGWRKSQYILKPTVASAVRTTTDKLLLSIKG